MAFEVHTRKLAKSWAYDFKVPGHQRQRKGGFRTKAEARTQGRKRLDELLRGDRLVILADAYEQYMTAIKMKDRTRDAYQRLWERVDTELGHVYIEQVDTPAMDSFKQTLPAHLSPNHHLRLIKAVLRFMWKRGKLQHVPYVPMERVPTRHQDWYTQEERDRLLDGMFRMYPQWYLFFYLTCRLGLRRGEIYAITHTQVRDVPPTLIVDQQVQRGIKTRPAMLIQRKNNEAYTLALSQDVVEAIRWHISKGYGGPEFLFSRDGQFPRYVDSYMRPLKSAQEELGLRKLGHHAIGRHSVASQAATGGESIKAIQAQLGHRSEQSTHKYTHLGSRAQLRVVEALAPASPPHVNLVSTGSPRGGSQ